MGVVAGTLGVLVVVLLLDLSTGLPGGVLTAVHWLGLAAVLAISWSRLPAERRSDALPLRSGWRWWAVAAVAGLLTFGVASLWVALANRGAPPEAVPEATDDMAWQVLLVAVLPSLVEEALCRGILWRALDRALRPLALMMATAALFALLHGLNGSLLLEFPHRFAAGLVFGLLRDRSGSVGPPIAAHFVNNLLAVVAP